MITASTRPLKETFATRELWLAARRHGLGGSDAPVVLGVSSWMHAMELWCQKVGIETEPSGELSEPQFWGLKLESIIGEVFGERTSREVEMAAPYTIIRSPDWPIMAATLDAIQRDPQRGPGVLQIKTCNAFAASDWESEPPIHYQVQLQHEIAVAGLSWGSLVVLIGGQKLVWFDRERDDRLIAQLIRKEKEFWRLVETGSAPEPDGSDSSLRAIRARHPKDDGRTIPLPKEFSVHDAELTAVKRKLKELEEREKWLTNRFRSAIGDATFGETNEGIKYSFRHVGKTRQLKRVTKNGDSDS